MPQTSLTSKKPFGIYTRVSDQGDRSDEELHSHDMQRETTERALHARGIEFSKATYRDNSRSGGKMSRPAFDELLALVAEGKLRGIAVAYLDRFSRSDLVDALLTIQQIEKAGGEIIALDADFDTTTAMGKAMLQISLVFGSLFREQCVEKAKTTAAKKLASGTSLGGKAAVGYEWEITGVDSNGKDIRGWLVPASNFDIVRDARLGFASGKFTNGGKVADFLNEHGVTTSRGSRWNARNVLGFLRNEVYTGTRIYGEQRIEGAHTPMHDTGTQRVITRKLQPKRTGTRTRGQGHLLGHGLLRCGKCGLALTQGNANRKYKTLRCNGRGGGHATISYGIALDWIEKVAFVHGTGLDLAEYTDRVKSLRQRPALVARVEEARAAVEEFEAQIGTALPDSSLQKQALATAEDALLTFDAEAQESDALAVETLAQYEALTTLAEKAEALRKIVSEVVVNPGGIRGSRQQDPGSRIVIKFHDGRQHPAVPQAADVPVAPKVETRRAA
jgi:DNA invertase Pin-like site-specific DNA recombinase